MPASRHVSSLHQQSRGTYGVPRIHAELKDEDERVGGKRIARLMRDLGLRGVCRRRFVTTTQRDDDHRPAPDLVDRDFTASRANALWVADATYVPTWEGFLYLAVVVDVFSRRVVGWSMANHLRTELMIDALEMAVAQRRPKGVIHHSDQGAIQGLVLWIEARKIGKPGARAPPCLISFRRPLNHHTTAVRTTKI